jgi:hypothetical protein
MLDCDWSSDVCSSDLRGIDLTEFDEGLQPYNPRLVQQAMYLFMSTANRRAATVDCMHLAPARCAACPGALRNRCPATSTS